MDSHITDAIDLMYFAEERGSNLHSCAWGGSCFEISFCTVIRMYYISHKQICHADRESLRIWLQQHYSAGFFSSNMITEPKSLKYLSSS